MNKFVTIGKRSYNVRNIVSVRYEPDTYDFYVLCVNDGEYLETLKPKEAKEIFRQLEVTNEL